MNFVHPHFFIFLFLFLIPYYATKGNRRQYILLIASYIFYAYFSIEYCALLFISTLADYLLVQKMNPKEIIKSKKWVTISILFNLSLLVIFKYRAFLVNDFLIYPATFIGFDLPKIQGGLPPMGISFFTFQTMSYSIDVYRGNLKRSHSFLQFAVYVSMFPQLVAGPIVRAKDLLPQIGKELKLRKEDFIEGSKRFLWGFAKKACLADSLALILVDDAFANPASYSSWQLCLAMVGYSFQIYFDFSGYSDMAIGVGRLIGYKFPENFNHPYQSKSFSEFWTRWHISLSSWLRDYLYIPLGGNRKGTARTFINLMLTMLLGGLWHGASYLFILWGFLHGLLLVIERIILTILPNSIQKFIPSWVKVFLTSLLVTLCWVPFRAQNLSDVWLFWKAPFLIDYSFIFTYLNNMHWNIKLLLLICFISHYFRESLQKKLLFQKWPFEIKSIFFASLIFWITHYYPESSKIQAFIYFQF